MTREKETEENPGGHDMRTGDAATTLLTTSEVTAEDCAGVPAYLLIIVRQGAQETVCHLVEVGGHPRCLDTHKISARSIHDRGKQSDALEVLYRHLEHKPAPGCNQHGHEDGGPAHPEHLAHVLVVVGEGDEDGEDEKVSPNDDLSLVSSGSVIKVEDVGDPCEEAEGDHITQGGRNGRGDVVRVTAELPGGDNHDDHDQGQGEAGETGRDHGAGTQKERLLVVCFPCGDPAHGEAAQGSQEPHHDALTLDQDQVTDDVGQSHLGVIQVTKVGCSGHSGSQSHFEIALETQEGRHHDDDLRHGDECGPALDVVQEETGAHHAAAGHEVGREDLEDNLPPLVIPSSAGLHDDELETLKRGG